MYVGLDTITKKIVDAYQYKNIPRVASNNVGWPPCPQLSACISRYPFI